jgi:hypothetical protein
LIISLFSFFLICKCSKIGIEELELFASIFVGYINDYVFYSFHYFLLRWSSIKNSCKTLPDVSMLHPCVKLVANQPYVKDKH